MTDLLSLILVVALAIITGVILHGMLTDRRAGDPDDLDDDT